MAADDTPRATQTLGSERSSVAPTEPIDHDTDGASLTVVPDSSTVGPDKMTTVSVVLSEAPDGIAGFNITVTVDNPDVLTIRQAHVSDSFGLEETTRAKDSVSVKGVDLNEEVESGSSDVTLAVVTLEALEEGTTQLTVRSNQFDSDDGSRISVTEQSAEITVSGDETGPTEGPGPSETPEPIGTPGLPDSSNLSESPTPPFDPPGSTQTTSAEPSDSTPVDASPAVTTTDEPADAPSTVATTSESAGGSGPGFGPAATIAVLLLTGYLFQRIE
ncbi:MAG: hypothetical protein V5A45_07065 [Haloarculaceae archaeon]